MNSDQVRLQCLGSLKTTRNDSPIILAIHDLSRLLDHDDALITIPAKLIPRLDIPIHLKDPSRKRPTLIGCQLIKVRKVFGQLDGKFVAI
ncbi:hypothetical protein KCU64_g66, partial [Aureobasidium melanogenum]